MKLTSEASGTFAIAPTPFFDDGRIDFDSIDRLTDFYAEVGCNGVTVLGSYRNYLIPAASVTTAPKDNGDWSIVDDSIERSIVSVREQTGQDGDAIAYDCTAKL